MRRPLKTVLTLGASAPILLVLMGSDHQDGPAATADHPADIADLYAWHDAQAGTFDVALDFAGFGAPGAPATYDHNVLYTIDLERSATAAFTNQPSVQIQVLYGQDQYGHWGVEVQNVPGTSGPIVGPVEHILADGPVRKIYTGLRDDPFFFDLDGFHTSLATHALAFNSHHDSFAGTNITTVVIEMALSDATLNGTMPHLQVWATTGRLPDDGTVPHGITERPATTHVVPSVLPAAPLSPTIRS
jgi:hypothetical protein